jgi:hypothetical protein
VEAKDMPEDDLKSEKTPEQITMQDTTFQQPLFKSSKPKIAGILLIIAGIIVLISVIQVATMDEATLQLAYNATQTQITQLDTNMTQEQFKQNIIMLCGTTGGVIAALSIFGGVLALKRKIWGLALVASIPQSLLGIIVPGFSPLFASGIMALVGLLLIAFSRREFR